MSSNQGVALLLGQLMSFAITGTGVTSQLLAQRHNVNIPTTQSGVNYLLLAIVYSLVLLKQGKLRETITSISKMKYYFLLAFIDVEANFLVVKAYQYTNITSITLLDCFSIPCVVLFTGLFLKTRYNLRHILGVILCIGGLAILVYSDINTLNVDSKEKLIGDVLCLAGALLYAVSNVGAEAFSKKYNRVEYLAMVGSFGTLVSLVQIGIFERSIFGGFEWSWDIASLLIAFTACLFLVYSVLPIALILGGSALLNLSLLTSDVFAIITSIFLFKAELNFTFYIAFTVILLGLLCYNIKNELHSEPDNNPPKEDTTNESHESPSNLHIY
uniref:EamA domain-containing protein n=1 Tax=Arcella intermedia TaxID=1963864 RepID=A0A6B2L9V4_9EUKA